MRIGDKKEKKELNVLWEGVKVWHRWHWLHYWVIGQVLKWDVRPIGVRVKHFILVKVFLIQALIVGISEERERVREWESLRVKLVLSFVGFCWLLLSIGYHWMSPCNTCDLQLWRLCLHCSHRFHCITWGTPDTEDTPTHTSTHWPPIQTPLDHLIIAQESPDFVIFVSFVFNSKQNKRQNSCKKSYLLFENKYKSEVRLVLIWILGLTVCLHFCIELIDFCINLFNSLNQWLNPMIEWKTIFNNNLLNGCLNSIFKL